MHDVGHRCSAHYARMPALPSVQVLERDVSDLVRKVEEDRQLRTAWSSRHEAELVRWQLVQGTPHALKDQHAVTRLNPLTIQHALTF